MSKVNVVSATVCQRCESIVGAEKVVQMEEVQFLKGMKEDPERHIAYPDVRRKSEYRLLAFVNRCVQC